MPEKSSVMWKSLTTMLRSFRNDAWKDCRSVGLATLQVPRHDFSYSSWTLYLWHCSFALGRARRKANILNHIRMFAFSVQPGYFCLSKHDLSDQPLDPLFTPLPSLNQRVFSYSCPIWDTNGVLRHEPTAPQNILNDSELANTKIFCSPKFIVLLSSKMSYHNCI